MSGSLVVPASSVTRCVLPVRTPHVIRTCPRCNTRRAFASSDRFRVNASGRRLDVWLIYRCAYCDVTWNLTVVERSTPESIGAEVFVPDYRLAPESPYPAALEDALAAFRHVRSIRPGWPLFVCGDSAGGGLGLSLLLKLRDLGQPMPDGAVLLSPWTDLTASGGSVDDNRGRDLWFSRRHLEGWARYYLGRADARSPYLSPVFADLSGLPPLLLLAGEHELLLDDARRVHEAASRLGVASRLHIGPGMQHDWPLTLPWLGESKRAWHAMRRFVEEGSRRARSG
jgi:acetyl esterase/lipase